MKIFLHMTALIISAAILSQICAAQTDDATACLPIGCDEAIFDGDYYTVLSITPEEPLVLNFEKEISSFYIVFNTVPSPYSIIINSGVKTYGEDGFLHQYAEFGTPTDVVKIAVSSNVEICDVYGFCGEAPSWVQKWEQPCESADILLLAAHADDELLMFGGTLPYYAGELDLSVQVAYMTSHWNEQPRPHELLDGLWTVGVENYPVIGIVDDIPCWSYKQAQNVFDEQQIIAWETELIRRFRPSVILTHDIAGEYGHGAHMMAAHSTMTAIEAAADKASSPESAEKYGVWDTPKVYLHFWEENAITMDWEIPLDYFGGITAREAAALGYDRHRSQHVWGYSVNYGKYWDCRQFGLYRSLVGTDFSADFMENITPYSEITTAPETTTETITSPPETVTTFSVTTTVAASYTTEPDTKTNPDSQKSLFVPIICVISAVAVLTIIIALIASRRR